MVRPIVGRATDAAPRAELDALFKRATGHRPYAYQSELGLAERLPDVVEVPTGSGKTQGLLLAWLFRRRVRGEGPRRLIYALPMRTLVEQTRNVALDVRRRLELPPDELPVHVLMGGEEASDWQEHPDRDQILVGTIDMLLSRALNRGYGESRFRWPVSYGLLNSDCLWIFDEVQLMGPARATSAQLDGLRQKLGTALPCETCWVSATIDADVLLTVDRPDVGRTLRLPSEDRTGALSRRLEAVKTVVRADLAATPPAQRPRTTAREVLTRHTAGTRSIVVHNTVARAQAVARQLRKVAAQPGAPDIVLLHSRFRPGDRADRLAEALAPVQPDGPGRIVVATQVIEAGVDVSSSLLATETAPFSSIVQRLGRCNRAGEEEAATVLWVDEGETDAKRSAPYDPVDLAASRVALTELEGESASPERLEGMEVAEQREGGDVLRRRDVLDLFDTTPDLSGLDVDVSRFIREDDDRSVSVFFRDLTGLESDQIGLQPAPARDELVDVPIGDVRGMKGRRAWVFDHLGGRWMSAASEAIHPGVKLMLDGARGGYAAQDGWDPKLEAPVSAVDPAEGLGPEEATSDDPLTAVGRWVTLSEHLESAQTHARELADTLPLPRDQADAVERAAALHDVGKAHAVFQEWLLSSVEGDAERRTIGSDLQAKSATRAGRRERPYFRHELASALALWPLRSNGLLPEEQRSLVVYLVGAHHGKVRLAIRPMPDERPPHEMGEVSRYALGIAEGDELPAVRTPLGTIEAAALSLACMELGGDGRSWTDVASGLRDDPAIGPFRLGFLEALVRIADWRASA